MANETREYAPEFRQRLDRYYDELKWLYCEIYHNDMQAFDYFVSMLYEYYCARKPALKEWDEARELVPDWYRGNEILGMMLYTGAFAGTLQGVKKHIPYLQETGVNTLFRISGRSSRSWAPWKTLRILQMPAMNGA